MSARELIVLGTASQVPTRYRAHHGCFLRWDDHGFLFDPGEGTQRQMTFAGITASSVTAICITHFHGDHSLGLAGVLQRLSLDRVAGPVPVFYPASGQEFFDRLKSATIYEHFTLIEPRPLSDEGVILDLPTLQLEARRLDHRVDTFGYALQEKPGRRMFGEKLAALGLKGSAVGRLVSEGQVEVDGAVVRIEDVSEPRPGQRFALVMDTRVCPGAEALAQGADLLVCESTYQEDCIAEAQARGHLTARQAAGIAVRAGARKLVLTHFSQRYPDNAGFVAEASALFPEVVAVYDLERVEVPRRS